MQQVYVFLILICSLLVVGRAINLREGPRPTQVLPGATASLTCDVDQKGGITVYWYRLETREYISYDRNIYTRLPVDRRRRLSIVGDRGQDVYTLRIANVVLADDGTYQCGYADGIGRFNVLASARLTILIPPSGDSPLCFVTTVSGNPRVRKVGDVVDMACTAEGGNPTPDLTWFRGAEELEENEGLQYAVHRQILRPADLNLNYTCVMRGPLITQRRMCTVFPMQVPPEVRIEPIVNSVTVGSTATFTCSMMGKNIGVRNYSWTVDEVASRRLQRSPERLKLKHSDRVLEIQGIQQEDDNTVVTCQAQITTGELLTGTAKLVIVVEPTEMTTGRQGVTTTMVDDEGAFSTAGSWQRSLRPTVYRTELADVDDFDTYNMSDIGVTVGMKPKLPAFLTGRTFILTSAAAGGFIVILIIVTIVIVKIVRQRNGKKLPITTPMMAMEHGNDTYATVLEMKRNSGSTYKGSATLPALKSDRKICLPDVMRGGSSLSLSARGSTNRSKITERSPLYAKPDKSRSSKHGLLADSKPETPDDSNYSEFIKDHGYEKSKSASSTLSNKELNAEGLIYADLILSDESKPKRVASKKGTQYASIIPSGRP